jgi:hypothetical protein
MLPPPFQSLHRLRELHKLCAWFDKLTMRDGVGCTANHKRYRIKLPAILQLPHGELVEPRTTTLQCIYCVLSVRLNASVIISISCA